MGVESRTFFEPDLLPDLTTDGGQEGGGGGLMGGALSFTDVFGSKGAGPVLLAFDFLESVSLS